MNNLLNIKTPSESQAGYLKSDFDLKNHGLTNLRKAYWNLPTESLCAKMTVKYKVSQRLITSPL